MEGETLFPICGHFWGMNSKKDAIFEVLNANLDDEETVTKLRQLTYIFLRSCAVISVVEWCVKLLQVTDENLIENLISPDVCEEALHLLLHKGYEATSTLANVETPNIKVLESLVSVAINEPEDSVQVPKMLLKYANADCGVAVCYNSMAFKLLRMCNKIKTVSPTFLQNCAMALLLNLGYIKINKRNCRYIIDENICRPVTSLQTLYSAFTGKINPVFRSDSVTKTRVLDILNVNEGNFIA